VLHTQGRQEEAVKEYAAALRSDPTLAQAHNNLGVLLLQEGRLSEGADQLAEAARLQPDNFEYRYNLATALNQEKRWDQAAEILSSLVIGHRDDPNLNFQLALALAHLQKTRGAMNHYALALLRQPEFPEALNGLSWILATDPHPEFRNGAEAVRMAEGACSLTGRKQAPLLATLAAAYGEADRFPEAVAAAREAQQLAANSGQKEIEAKCRALLETLESGRPWRETMQ
jgi:tetratricopeptide (TPR) repeat protein